MEDFAVGTEVEVMIKGEGWVRGHITMLNFDGIPGVVEVALDGGGYASGRAESLRIVGSDQDQPGKWIAPEGAVTIGEMIVVEDLQQELRFTDDEVWEILQKAEEEYADLQVNVVKNFSKIMTEHLNAAIKKKLR